MTIDTVGVDIEQRDVPVADGRIVARGTPDEIRASSDPFVHQFVNAEADGPVPFHYPAPPIDSLLDVRLP